jgi:hypothetical protein
LFLEIYIFLNFISQDLIIKEAPGQAVSSKSFTSIVEISQDSSRFENGTHFNPNDLIRHPYFEFIRSLDCRLAQCTTLAIQQDVFS